MAFVDDVRTAFDAAEFCTLVTAGVGEGAISSGLALRDSSAAHTAGEALRYFHMLATTRGPPDVVAAYVQFSPGASELFTALRAVATRRNLAELGLDCLTAIVRYSLDSGNPLHALEAARSVVKEVVKTRAVLIYEVFVNDQRGCAKKALNLLRLVAQCHPILAKEIVNRFDLGAPVMAPALCSEENKFCRVPFLDLLFVLLASGDYDVANALGTRARGVLLTCLRVIQQRTLKECNPNLANGVSTASANKKWKGKPSKNEPKQGPMDKTITPSHVQKRELIAAINLLLAIERHILNSPNHFMRRSAFADPMPEILASIAAADMPPLSVAPRQVVPEHEALRATSSSIFIALATDQTIARIPSIVTALNATAATDSTAAVSFVLRVIEEQPRVCKHLLETGPYLNGKPALSSAWFGRSAVISACVLRLEYPTSQFVQRRFFENCLSHTDALIRYTGVLTMQAFCKVVQADRAAETEPQKFLPPLLAVEGLLRKHNCSDEATQKLLASYQKIFDGDVEESQADLIKLSVDSAGDDLVLSEDSIRTALTTSPRDSVSSILRKGYFSKLAMCAAEVTDRGVSRRLWYLCRDILKSSDLFTPGSEAEIDVYMCLLSSMGADLKDCAAALEKVVFNAWKMPYLLFDEIQDNSHPLSKRKRPDKTSMLSVAALLYLRKLRALQDASKTQRVDAVFGRMLSNALTTIVACHGLLGSERDVNFLRSALPTTLNGSDIWWSTSSTSSNEQINVTTCCQIAQRLCSPEVKYPRTPYLRFVQATSLSQLQVLAPGAFKSSHKTACADSGVLWNAWRNYRGFEPWAVPLDPFRDVYLQRGGDHGHQKVLSGMSFGLLLEGLEFCRGESGIMKGVEALKCWMGEKDFAVFIAAVLRKTSDNRVRGVLACFAVEVLEAMSQGSRTADDLDSYVQESLLESVRCKGDWNEPQIRKFITFANGTLNKGNGKTCGDGHVSFAISLLLRLVTHEDAGTSLRSRRFLSAVPDVTFLPLGSLSLVSASEISFLLPHYPSLQRIVISQIWHWTKGAFERAIPGLLPLLARVLKQGAFVPVKRGLGYVQEDMCLKVLEGIRSVKGTAVDCQEKEISASVEEAVGEIGKVVVASEVDIEAVLALVRESQKGEDEALSSYFWLFLTKVFTDEPDEQLSLKVGDVSLFATFTTMLDWLSRELRLDDRTHTAALTVFHSVLKLLRTRRVAVYELTSGSATDATVLEKSLTVLSSNIMKGLHRSLGCCAQDGQEAGGPPSLIRDASVLGASLKLALLCVKEILLLDLVLDKAAKRSLLSISTHDGEMLLEGLRREQNSRSSVRGSSCENGFAHAAAALVLAALTHLPRFGVEEDVATCLSVVEAVFSLEISGYRASRRAGDLTIRKCMQGISQCLKMNGARDKFSLLERKTGLFGPTSSQVVALLDKKRLECTCNAIFAHASTQHTEIARDTGEESIFDTRQETFDPVFVLHTFLLACGEALKSPGSAVLDIGRIAKEGPLGLSISGIASEDEELRALAYASLDAFSRVVGPVSGVPLGSASALYKDRKQLSFLIALLKNSVTDPMMKVLPLFAVWFRISAKVALTASHPANKAVTFLFLRSPSLDVLDCHGASSLLRCEAYGQELKSTRLLALNILRQGVRSVSDMIVLRKRKVLDTLLMLGGSSCGQDRDVRREVLNTFGTILARDREVSLSHELIFSHGFVPWLLQDAEQGDAADDQLKYRLAILRHLSSSFADRKDRERSAIRLSRALTVLAKKMREKPELMKSTRMLDSITECAAAICCLAPGHRGLICIDFAHLSLESLSQDKTEAVDKRALATVIARQRNHDVDPIVLSLLMESSLFEIEECSHECTSLASLEQSTSLEISMAHAFVAESLLYRRRKDAKGGPVGSELCLLLAKTLSVCPTVWLTVACICALDLEGALTGDLASQTERLPAYPPRILDVLRERQFCNVVDNMRLAIIDNLISCSSDG